MMILKITLLATCVAACLAQYPSTTPVPILKQINRQNDDGSYSFGYEAADGSFKIETKYPNGDVAGKYGYVDVDGKQREISYGASSQRGFEPQGSGIMVPPPTLHDPSSNNALTDGQEDDGQYREDPKIYEDPKYYSRAAKGNNPPVQFSFQSPKYQASQQTYQPAQQTYQPAQQYQPSPSQPIFQQQYQAQNYNPAPTASPIFRPNTDIFNQAPQAFPQREIRPQSQAYHQTPQFSFQSYQQPQTYQPQNYQQYTQPQYQAVSNPYANFNPFTGHPAQNFDPSTGSYTINFTG